MRLSLVGVLTIGLFLAVFSGCGSEEHKPSKPKPANYKKNPDKTRTGDTTEQDLEDAKIKRAQQKLEEAQRDLEKTRREAVKVVEKAKQDLSKGLGTHDKKIKITMIKGIMDLVEIIEKNPRKSKEDILTYLGKIQKSKSDSVVNYLKAGQKPTTVELERLSQEEINNIHDDLGKCVLFLFRDGT